MKNIFSIDSNLLAAGSIAVACGATCVMPLGNAFDQATGVEGCLTPHLLQETEDNLSDAGLYETLVTRHGARISAFYHGVTNTCDDFQR